MKLIRTTEERHKKTVQHLWNQPVAGHAFLAAT